MDYRDLVKVVEGSRSTGVEAWAASNREAIEQALAEVGAILLRGFEASDENTVERVLRVVSTELLDDAFWSTPRTGVAGKTFTATEYPGPRTISLHSEMAYMSTFPRFLAFHSIKVAETGGETTIGHLDAVSRDLQDVLPRFRGGVTYRRNYHPGVDIPWRQAFRVESREQAERVAQKNGMTLRWGNEDSLQTVHTAQGVATALDGSVLWFNQAHVFHCSNLEQKDRAALTELFGPEGLPRDAVFASGEAIPDELVAHIQEVLRKNTVGVAWQAGDVLLLDNMRFMHGRHPFTGSRKVHVAMAKAQKEAVRTDPFAKAGLLGRMKKAFFA